jgi:cyclophilin family peptidyl-prolyl cis-trans isomerase|tara:strand:- start:2731 stop:3441 length:711 start_codon:yes stop_codon:yes gene_type:complete
MKKNFRLLLLLPFILNIAACKEEPSKDKAVSVSEKSTDEVEAQPSAETNKGDKAPELVTRIIIDTSMGVIELDLNAEKAPLTVANFLLYIDSKHFDDTVFHRVIEDFMIQGGGFAASGDEKETLASIKNESANGLSNARGTIAMARTNHPDSATAQFFINVGDNTNLDGGNGRPGYTVFGKVVSGIDVVDAIRAVKTGQKTMKAIHPDGRLYPKPFQDVPMKDVVIKSIKRSNDSP